MKKDLKSMMLGCVIGAVAMGGNACKSCRQG